MSDEIKKDELMEDIPAMYSGAGARKKEENIIKKARDELGFKNYKELADAIGYKLVSLNQAASKDSPSAPMVKAIKLLYKIKELEEKLANCNELKKSLNNLLKD